MATCRVEVQVPAERGAAFLDPRTDLLIETEVEPGRFVQDVGPFRTYERTVKVHPAPPGTVKISETTRFRMAIPVWGRLIDLLMARALGETDRRPRHRWWWPDEVVTSHTTNLIALLSILGMVGAYIGVTIGQTITFAAAEFGSTDTAQANALAATRIGVLVTTVVIWRADIVGRKPLLVLFAAGASLATVAGAFAPGLVALTVTQAVARGFATGMLTLVTLAATEEIPRTMRAFILSLLTLCGALGAGAVVWVLPLAGIDERGWRLVYLVPLLFLPVVRWIWRAMPETRRFSAADRVHAPGFSAVRRRWFFLLAFVYFATAAFSAPAGQLQNEYLRDDVGFSAADISVFRLAISTPAGLVVLAAGWMADRRGRRLIGSVSMAIGAVSGAAFFAQEGAALWAAGMVTVWLGGAAFPVIRAYQTELFPTRARALAGGWVDLIAVSGSAIGLVVAGQLIAGGRDIAGALWILLPLPLLAAATILLFFPHTAGTELERLNPTDPVLDRRPPAGSG